jgi:hypothetical protein
MDSLKVKKRAQRSRQVEASEPADRRQCLELPGRVVQAGLVGWVGQAELVGWPVLVGQFAQAGRPYQLNLPTVPRMENTRR